MNPLKWVRWKVVIVLAVLVGVFYFLGVNPLAQWQINRSGDAEKGANWSVSEVALGLLAGDVELLDLLIAAAKVVEKQAEAQNDGEEKEKVFNADKVEFDLSVGELARRRVVIDQMGIVNPHMEVRRHEDGSTNVGDLEDSDIEWPDAKQAEDWVRSAIEWYKKLQKHRDKLPSGDPEEEREKQKKLDYWKRKVEYPYNDRPTYLVRRIFAEGLEVNFADEDKEAKGKLPKLTDGTIEITGLSSNPSVHDKPMKLSISGLLDGAKENTLSLDIGLDYTGGKADYFVDFKAPKIPISVVQAFVGDSLPVELTAGVIGLEAKLGLDGKDNLQVAPKLSFAGVRLAQKPGEDRVAGVNAAEFVKAFNEASNALGDEPLNIADLTIGGTLSSPKFNWGNTVTDLIKQGGKAFAKKQIDAGIEKGLEKITPKVDEALEKAGIDGALKDRIKGVIPGKDDSGSATDKIKGLIPGLGGGKKD